MAKSKPNPITYSTAENFNPLQDPDVSMQMRGDQGSRYETDIWPSTARRGIEGGKPLNTEDFNSTQNLKNFWLKDKPNLKNSELTARYETEASARSAAPHNAGITHDNTVSPHGKSIYMSNDIGYVPKAEKVANTTSENYLNSPSVQNTLRTARENTAAREAKLTPAQAADYRGGVYAKEAAKQRAAGNEKSAAYWETEAKKLGYSAPAPKPATSKPAASKPAASKPAASTAPAPAPKPAATKRDWDKRPPISDSDVIAYERDLNAQKAKPASLTGAPKPSAPQPLSGAPDKPAPPKNTNPIAVRQEKVEAEQKAIGYRPEEIKQSDIDVIKKRSESYVRDRDIYTKNAQEYDRQGKTAEANEMWQKAGMADKVATIAAKNAKLLEKDKAARDSEIVAWDEKKKKYDGSSPDAQKAMEDIPKLSDPKPEKIIIDMPDPMQGILDAVSSSGGVSGTASDPFSYTPPGAGPKMTKAYGNEHSTVMVKARAQVA